MPITTSNPLPVDEPENEYDKYLIDLQVSPSVTGNTVEGVAQLRLIPYRVLTGGVLDVRYDRQVSITHPQLFAAATADADLGAFVTSVLTAVQTFVSAKGL